MKVSLYLQDEIWKKFKRGILRRTGELRSLSSEVQELIEENSLRKGFAKMKVDAKPRLLLGSRKALRGSLATSDLLE